LQFGQGVGYKGGVAKLLEQHTHPSHPRLYLQLRSDSKWLQAVFKLDGRKRQHSTRTAHLPTAYRLAEDWYTRELRVLRGDEKRREPLSIPLMEELFLGWVTELYAKKRSWVEMKWGPVARFWEARRVSEVTTQTFKEFYRWRRQQKPAPKNPTLHQDVVLIRQILKYAVEEQHIPSICAIPSVGQIEPNPRPWLTRQEWDHLSQVSEERIRTADNVRVRRQREELDNQMVWMVNTMMRVDEMRAVRFRDCRITTNAEGREILLCEVKGKRGIRTVVGRSAARDIFKSYGKRGFRDTTNRIFPTHHREALTELLKAAGLHKDHLSGFERNFKSFRCTAISFAVLQGIDLMWIARNAGTSVTMIDSFYARRLSAEMAKDQLTQPWKDG
jgi:hypothetical protein